jgi:hypothetical protein
VKTFGPDVNLGNVTTDVVIETETIRLGLGSVGPLSVYKLGWGVELLNSSSPTSIRWLIPRLDDIYTGKEISI